MKINPFLLCDGYKTSHKDMYPEGTNLVYSNFTPRCNKYSGSDYVISFGQQLTIQWIKDVFKYNFFNIDKTEVCNEIKKEYSMYLGYEYDVSHIEELHDLGYLPLVVKSIPEGEKVPHKVPVLTLYNTLPEFYWLPNFLETIISNLLWKPLTSATIAHKYKSLLTKWAEKTDKDNVEFVGFQGHDFSMRGLDSPLAAITSGLGHATSFLGSDTLPVIHGSRKYYGEEGFVVGSVPATEHSIMCAGTKGDDIGTFRHLRKQFPKGILSIVSDTWDLWKVITEYLPQLKEEILARDGKIVIRPDSGDPVDIICGDRSENLLDTSIASNKGVIELLWDIFGGTTNQQGYKVLDQHIGAIYGDSITLARADEICRRLEAKGFASTNIVLGVGSFTYQYNTRDTEGLAMKATYVEVNGEGREIFKDPITDDGTKKSAKGLLSVKGTTEMYLVDQEDWEGESEGNLQEIFRDGKFLNQTTLSEIRAKL